MGTLSLFNLYVTLSRSLGQDTIQLLRDFEEQHFHDTHLMDEDDRLEKMDQITRDWWTSMRWPEVSSSE